MVDTVGWSLQRENGYIDERFPTVMQFFHAKVWKWENALTLDAGR
jgi:hypothetical protein